MKIVIYSIAALLVFASTLLIVPRSSATAIPTGDFSIEVSPSPLTLTVEPGKEATTELKIRNASLTPETLKIEARSFTISKIDGSIKLSDSTPKDLASWVSYAKPTFTIQPGEWFSQTITVNLPDAAGFSYPFAVVISRANDASTSGDSTRLIKGSVAVFALVNISKPGATRELAIESLTASQPIYEYLPAEINIKLKNTGNSIVQPYGNVYIQRNIKTTTPLAVLPLNSANNYILPGTSKEIAIKWDDGYPVYKQSGDKQTLEWDADSTSHFRLGKYTARVVAVYNDGTRDIPITGEVSFWVIPWRIILLSLVIVGVLGIGIWSIVRQITQKFSHLRKPKQW